MKIIRNERLIRRNRRIGMVTSLVSLVVLGIGMFISLRMQEQFVWVLVTFIVGFLLTQVSIYYGNRWGRSPRPDEVLDGILKGLPGNYVLYHYVTPASHLLIGPAGIWVLLPYALKGTITYQKGRWRVRGGGFWQAYLRFWGQEGLGRPELEAEAEIRHLQKFFGRLLDQDSPPIQALLIFTHPQAELQIEASSPFLALPAKKVKDFLRRKAKETPLDESSVRALQKALEQS
ncbi:MAG: hypothetical protein ACK4VW_00760 [Anaerolineales bacterium]